MYYISPFVASGCWHQDKYYLFTIPSLLLPETFVRFTMACPCSLEMNSLFVLKTPAIALINLSLLQNKEQHNSSLQIAILFSVFFGSM
jgi:hypothetical protein